MADRPDSRRPFTTIGVPIDSVGLGRAEAHGTELAPAAVRAAGLDRLGWADAGDLPVRIPDHDRDAATGLVGIEGVLEMTTAVRESVASSLRAGDRPFLLGGCCSLVPGALAGARDVLGQCGLIYVDGHLDLYDGVSSPTGEAADMPVAVILGVGPRPWMDRVAPVPVVMDRSVALLGYHDADELVDLGERLDEHRAAGLFAADAATIERDGPGAVARAAMDHVRRGVDAVWFHVDLDVLDQDVFPATDYLNSGGLDWDAFVELSRPIAADPRLVGWSVSCYNPEKDPGGRNGRELVDAIERIFSID